MEMSQNLKSFIGIALQAICITGCLILLGTAFATYTAVQTRSKPTETKHVHQFELVNITEAPKMEMNVKEDMDDMEADNWVVLMTVNNAYLSFFQNWFWNFERLHLRVPVIVIAEDDACFEMLKALYKDKRLIKVVRNENDGTDPLIFDRSPAFNRLLRERHSHILQQLNLGKDVVFCDVDSVWLQNPFPYFSGDFDIWAQFDGCQIREGFMAIKSNNQTIDFISEWKYYLVVRHINGDAEDDIRVVSENPHEWELRLKTLASDRFPTGDEYLNDFDDEQRSNVVVVHSNHIQDYEGKMEALKKFHLWKI